jgi:glycosyltransferase involved in cell wall biosynthesis
MADGKPPDFAIFGRSPFEAGFMTWHWLAHELAADSPVTYVRHPRRRLLPRRTCAAVERSDGVLDVTPFELPLSRFAFPRRLARAAFVRTLGRHGRPPGPRTTAVLFPRSPLPLARALRPAVTVYWATDDFQLRPSGEADPVFAAWEHEAVAAADLVVGSSRRVAERLARTHGVTAHAIPNGFPAALLRRAPTRRPPGSAPPIFGFAGTIDPERLDLRAVGSAALSRPDATFLFAGPLVHPGDPRLAALFALPNVRRLEPVPVERVPDLVAGFDVALLPYRDTAQNRACSPLKALEALALGIPVLASPEIDDLLEYRPAATFFAGAADLPAALDRALALAGDPAALAPALAAARRRTWPAQVALFLDLLRA